MNKEISERQINEILAELYGFDKSLQEHEKDLRKMIKEILVSRPDTKFDSAFKERLRVELLEKIDVLRSRKIGSSFNFASLFAPKRLVYAGVGVIIALLVIIPLTSRRGQQPVTRLDFGLQIAEVSDSAFGTLAQTEVESPAGEKSLGGGGAAATATPSSQRLAEGGAEGGIVDEPIGKMIHPDYQINYHYIYQGEEITIDQEKMAVLKRVRGSRAAEQIASLLSRVDFDLMDLATFPQSKVQNLSFIQDKDFGYVINADLLEGRMSIYQNWSSWPSSKCQDRKCFEAERLKIEDVPADEILIKIADAFIKEHGINIQSYGQPEVLDTRQDVYLENEDKENFYIPESIQVLYPLIIDGMDVYESYYSGAKTGLRVMVNIKEKKVSDFSELTSQSYESSLYQTETDISKIMAIVEKGGLGSYQFDKPTKTVDIGISQPEIGYLRSWSYQEGEREELLVPALVFPITKIPDEVSFYKENIKENIVVPLIKKMLEEGGSNYPMPRSGPVILEESVELK